MISFDDLRWHYSIGPVHLVLLIERWFYLTAICVSLSSWFWCRQYRRKKICFCRKRSLDICVYTAQDSWITILFECWCYGTYANKQTKNANGIWPIVSLTPFWVFQSPLPIILMTVYKTFCLLFSFTHSFSLIFFLFLQSREMSTRCYRFNRF